MDFVWKLYGNMYAVHVTVALVGVVTLNLALPAPPVNSPEKAHSYLHGRRADNHALNYLHGGCRAGKSCIWLFARQIKFAATGKRYTLWKKKKSVSLPAQKINKWKYVINK